MKTIRHLIANDGHCLKLKLVAWAVLLLLPVALIAALHTGLGWSLGYFKFLQYSMLLVFFVQLIFQCTLTIEILQKENVCSRKAYWLTRPVPWSSLFVAKGLSLSIYVLLPQLLMALMIWLAWPDSTESVLQLLPITTLFYVCMMAYCAVGATLTRTSGQAFLMLLMAPILFSLLGFILAKIGLQGAVIPLVWELSQSYPIAWIFGVAGGLWGIAGFILRYRKPRQWWLGAICFNASVVCLILAAHSESAKSIELSVSTIELPEEAELEIGSFLYERIDFNGAGGSSTSVDHERSIWDQAAANSQLGVRAKLNWIGSPEGLLAEFEVLQTTMESGQIVYPDKRKSKRHLRFGRHHLNGAYQQSIFPDHQIAQEHQSGGASRHSLFLGSHAIKDRENEPLNVTSVIKSTFYKPKLTELTFAVGAQFRIGDSRFIIESIDWQSAPKLEVHFRYVDAGVAVFERPVFLALGDADTRQILFGNEGGGNSTNILTLLQAGQKRFSFRTAKGAITNLDGLKLYLVEHDLVGIDVRELSYRVGL